MLLKEKNKCSKLKKKKCLEKLLFILSQVQKYAVIATVVLTGWKVF